VESIPRILHAEDKSSMAFSVEERVPFIDKCLISYLFSLPARMKVRDGTSKWILRESLKGILPEKVRTRRTKLGFNSPEERWIASDDFQEFVRERKVIDVLENSVIDVSTFNRRIQQFRDGKRGYDPVFWRIYNYALWKQRFF
jgi:asparagine synthase (glutamine-hydrolysing)